MGPKNVEINKKDLPKDIEDEKQVLVLFASMQEVHAQIKPK